MCSSPKLIAAYHVLLRLIDPRHPPYALICFKKVYSVLDLRTISKVQKRRPLVITTIANSDNVYSITSTITTYFPNMSKSLPRPNPKGRREIFDDV